jgi:hypothetical protein
MKLQVPTKNPFKDLAALVVLPAYGRSFEQEYVLWICYLGNHFFMYRQSEAENV